jgi:ATP-dependent Clp protease ATP-binding subunit ClpA
MTPREAAEEAALNPYGRPDRLRILEICGGRGIETLRRERSKRAKQVMSTTEGVERAFEFAKQDAMKMGRSAVDQENLFIGMLRQGQLTVALLGNAGVDLPRLRAAVLDRIEPTPVDVPAEMTANPELSSILMDARTLVEERGDEGLNTVYVLHALVRHASPTVMNLIGSAGITREKLLESIERALPPIPKGSGT